MNRRVSARIVVASFLGAYAVLALSGWFRVDERFPPAGRPLLGPATVSGPRLEPGALVVAPDSAVGPVALDPRHVVWEAWPREGEGATIAPRLIQWDLRDGHKVTLARNVDQFKGLASTSGWVVYVSGRVGGNVVAVQHQGSRRVVLGRSLATPLASRGELVAWGEDGGTRQRVVVRDMAKGVTWVAAAMPRCEKGRCYRIDGVTLANQGVVFARGAIGPGPSFVVRRRFSDARPERVELPNDPQPDLAPSSAGALYHALTAGWFRWDFGASSPRPVPLSSLGNADIIAYERGTFFLLERRGCDLLLHVQSVGGKRLAVAPPARLRAIAGIGHSSCVQFTALVSTGLQPVTAWLVVPSEESPNGHQKGREYAGILHAGR